MGAKLMPASLKALGENVATMSALDRFARLEQLGWLASADEWQTLGQIRNQFTHDYPNNPTERFERLQACYSCRSPTHYSIDAISTQHRDVKGCFKNDHCAKPCN